MRWPDSFWQRVEKRDAGECWPWLGRLDADGYGILSRSTRPFRAHRLAFEITFGTIPDGLIVRHTCDNARCVNPAHLLLGTQSDNIADKVARDRQAKGERMGAAKLTEDAVRVIRNACAAGLSQSEMARRYGVSLRAVQFIQGGVTWRHVL